MPSHHDKCLYVIAYVPNVELGCELIDLGSSLHYALSTLEAAGISQDKKDEQSIEVSGSKGG